VRSSSVSSVTSCAENIFTGANGDNRGLKQPSYHIPFTQNSKIESEARSSSVSSVTSCAENIFTGANGDNGGLKQPILKSPAKES
jgi:hypothetical protein